MTTSRAVLARRLGAIGLALTLGACGGADDNPPASGEVVFRLSYRSDIPDSVFVQSSTELGGQGWLTVRPVNGEALTILDDCGTCDCASCQACAVCGIGLPVVAEIPRDGHLDWTWDARTFSPDTCPSTGVACERPAPLPAGDYVARFCWSWTSDGVGAGHRVGPVTCADEPFTYPPPAPVVEHAVCACG